MADHRTVLGLDGMTCSSCSGTIQTLLRGLEGVIKADVTLTTSSAVVEYIANTITPEQLCDEVESIGFGCQVLNSSELSTKSSDIESQSSTQSKIVSTTKNFVLCYDENVSVDQSTTLLREIKKINGIYDVSATGFGDKKALQISLDDSKAGPRNLAAAAKRMNIAVTINSHGGFMMATRLSQQYTQEIQRQSVDAVLATVLTIPVLVISHLIAINSSKTRFLMTTIVPGLDTCGFLLFILSTPVQWWVGYRFHKKAVLSIQSGTLGMDFLISTGTTASYLFSFIALVSGLVTGVPNDIDAAYFETSAVLITVVVIGKFLETYARGMTASAIHNLSTRRARYARIVTEPSSITAAKAMDLWLCPQISLRDSENRIQTAIDNNNADEEVDALLVHRGDVLRLVAGEVIPADGIVFSGVVGVDESMLTGESALVTKSIESVVYGGTLVAEGSAMIVVTACGDDSTLGKIVTAVQEAQSSKPPVQENADTIAKYFVPFVATISFLTFITWMFAWSVGAVPEDWYDATAITGSHMDHHMNMNSSSASKTGNPVLFAFFFALAVWVSACPCAFGLATPTAILVATGVAAKHGILVRRGAALQFTAEIQSIAFDKTGTLTLGKPRVTDVFVVDLNDFSNFSKVSVDSSDSRPTSLKKSKKDSDKNEEERLEILYNILIQAEMKSSHPLANGIIEFCRNKLTLSKGNASQKMSQYANLVQNEKFEVFAGQGIAMTLSNDAAPSISKFLGSQVLVPENKGIQVLVGSAQFLSSNGVHIPSVILATANGLRIGGKVAIFASFASTLVCAIGLSDTIRPEAPVILNYLRDQGITCYMVTGDDWNTAVAIGAALGIESKHIYSNAKPADKEIFVQALQDYTDTSTGQRITQRCLFIGDGTNDSPAMARASVGVAMAGGTDIAVEAGDLVFCKNNLSSLPTIISLSKRTMRRIWMNFGWAFGYNLFLIPVAAGAFYPVFHISLSPMFAGMAMALSSISIVISSLLLGIFTPPDIPQLDKMKSNNSNESTRSGSRHDADASFEMREFTAEDPLTCQCPTSTETSPRSSLLHSNTKKLTNPLGYPFMSKHKSYWRHMIDGMYRMVNGSYDELRTTDSGHPNPLQSSHETGLSNDPTSLTHILHQMRALSSNFGGVTSQSSSAYNQTSATASAVQNPFSTPGKLKFYDNSSISCESRTDVGCGCGCGGLNCSCPVGCSCNPYQRANRD